MNSHGGDRSFRHRWACMCLACFTGGALSVLFLWACAEGIQP